MGSGTLPSVPMADAQEVLERGPRLLVDLRSPAEYAEDSLPGAHNVPLFDDGERALIGTLYHRSSPGKAFEEARGLTRAKIGALTARVAELAGWEVPEGDLGRRVELMTEGGIELLERELAPVPVPPAGDAAGDEPGDVVLYCWRGGLRSRAVVAFLRGLGFGSVVGIAGGYRSYRAIVRGRLDAWVAPPSFVLRGLTGVGKTLVLRELARLRPEWVLDLEGEAGHRSSVLGAVGLRPATQKRFESRLAERVARGLPGPCVLEGESRKVGDIVLPACVWRAIDGGVALELTAPLERRVDVLVEDYLASADSRAELAAKLPFLEARLGARYAGVLVGLLAAGRERELVRLLLERYYDPLYRHSEGARPIAARFDAGVPAAAAGELLRWIERALAEAGPAEAREARAAPPARPPGL